MLEKTIEINPFEWVSGQFVLKARIHDDEASIILKGHLLVEYLLNRIIDTKLNISKRKTATFTKKVNMLYDKGLLTNPLHENIKRLNLFRNKLAHQLDYSIDSKDMLFTKTSGEVLKVKPKRGQYPERYYYRLLCHGVITLLSSHMLTKLKIDPRWVD